MDVVRHHHEGMQFVAEESAVGVTDRRDDKSGDFGDGEIPRTCRGSI
jgi:hypothetical protein